MTIKKTAELLLNIDRMLDKYSIPQPTEVLVDSDELDFVVTLFWNNNNKVYMDVYTKMICVYSAKNINEANTYNDLNDAVKQVLQYV